MHESLKYLVAIVAIAVAYHYYLADDFDPRVVSGKRVLITGASSGIGEHLAYEYAKHGARLLLVARRAPLLQAVADECQRLGATQVEIAPGNMVDREDRVKVLAEATKRLGGLDHLVLNHAVLTHGWWLGSEENLTRLGIDMNINFMSHVDLASRALGMLQESGGSIGVISSQGGIISNAMHTTYVTSKFAIQGFFSALRQEMTFRETGVAVTLCVLGLIDTDIARLNEKQKDFALVARQLCSLNAPKSAAMAIVRGITQREPEMYFGDDAWLLVQVHKVFPRFIEWYTSWMLINTYELS